MRTRSNLARLGALTIGLALLAPIPGAAQGQPNISGTWVLDSAKSKVGPGYQRGHGLPTATEMIITQTATEMTVDGSTPDSYSISGNPVPPADGLFRWTQKFLLNGTEFPANCPPCDAKGKAVWKDGKLTVTATRHLFAGALGYIDTVDTDVYNLAGDVLTIERTVDTASGPLNRVLVYNKKK